MFQLRHLNHNDLIEEYADDGERIALWLFKKKSKRSGTATLVQDYTVNGLNGIGDLEIGNVTDIDINDEINGNFRIIGNAEDYPEYLI